MNNDLILPDRRDEVMKDITTNLFDYLTTENISKNIEDIAFLEEYIRIVKPIIHEAKVYNSDQKNNLVSENYSLVVGERNAPTVYDTSLVSKVIRNHNIDLYNTFLDMIKISKTNLELLCKNCDLKLKDFDGCIKESDQEVIKTYTIKPIDKQS